MLAIKRLNSLFAKSEGDQVDLNGMLLSAVVVFSFIVMGIELFENFVRGFQDTEYLMFLIGDISGAGVVLMTFQLYMGGHQDFAGRLFLFCTVLMISIAFHATDLDTVFVLYALPVFAASFMLKPHSSVWFALLSIFGYAVNAAMYGFPVEFGFINTCALFVLAFFSWAISARLHSVVHILTRNESHLKTQIRLFQMPSTSQAEIMNLAINEGIHLTQSDLGYLALLDNREEKIDMFTWSANGHTSDYGPSLINSYATAMIDMCDEVKEQREPVVLNNHYYPDAFNSERKDPFISKVSVPIFDGKRLVGMMGFANQQHYYEPTDVAQITLLGTELWSLIERQKMFIQLEKTNQTLVEAYEETLMGWARALEIRDKETEQHCNRVTELSLQLARLLGVTEDKIPDFRRGVMLHDIGKIATPDSILLKPGPLTSEEWTVMRQHPRVAYDLLSPISFLRPAVDIPHYHHERWDGGGYPAGLKGEEIPFFARIFAVVDVWDALTSDRPYRKAWEPEQAKRYLREESGKQFDPRVVEAMLRLLD